MPINEKRVRDLCRDVDYKHPQPRIIVLFTEDGEATLKKYVPESQMGHYEVRSVKYSYSELQKIKAEVKSRLSMVGIQQRPGLEPDIYWGKPDCLLLRSINKRYPVTNSQEVVSYDIIDTHGQARGTLPFGSLDSLRKT